MSGKPVVLHPSTQCPTIVAMAQNSFGQLGAVPSEGFSERSFSNANDVLTKGNVLLSTEEVEHLTILRMAREFVTYMRGHSKYHKQLHRMRMKMAEETKEAEAAMAVATMECDEDSDED